MKKLRLPPAAVAAITFAGCYALVVGTGAALSSILGGLGLLAAAVQALVVAPAVSILVLRRVRRRDDLSANRKSVVTGFLAGAAVGFPLATLTVRFPVAVVLFLGLPTTLLGFPAAPPVGTIADTGILIRLLLFNPHVLMALNCALVGSAIGWIAAARADAPAGDERTLARGRVLLSSALFLGPALGFALGLSGQHAGLQDWREAWSLTVRTIASNEYAAIRGLRAIGEAQKAYRESGHGRSYAPSFFLLCEQSRDAAGPPDRALEGSTCCPTSGYVFTDIRLDKEGKVIDPEKGFAVCAFPARCNRSGLNTFFVTSEGTVYQKAAVGPMVKLPSEEGMATWIVTSNE